MDLLPMGGFIDIGVPNDYEKSVNTDSFIIACAFLTFSFASNKGTTTHTDISVTLPHLAQEILEASRRKKEV